MPLCVACLCPSFEAAKGSAIRKIKSKSVSRLVVQAAETGTISVWEAESDPSTYHLEAKFESKEHPDRELFVMLWV